MMLDQMKILTARRAYEFRPDDLRLTALTTRPVQQLIQQTFRFQTTGIGTPIQTFGPVPATIPPGLSFDAGFWLSPEETLVPIRFLIFEQFRLVIDVAGSSSAIQAIFEQLREVVKQVPLSGGSAIIGEPERLLDYSEISARFASSLDAIFLPKLRTLFTRIMGAGTADKSLMLAPTLHMQVESMGENSVGGITAPDSRMFQLAPRLGAHPEEHLYFSGAPLDTETHLAYLQELDAILSAASEAH